jgi:hypothetical protein
VKKLAPLDPNQNESTKYPQSKFMSASRLQAVVLRVSQLKHAFVPLPINEAVLGVFLCVTGFLAFDPPPEPGPPYSLPLLSPLEPTSASIAAAASVNMNNPPDPEDCRETGFGWYPRAPALAESTLATFLEPVAFFGLFRADGSGGR